MAFARELGNSSISKIYKIQFLYFLIENLCHSWLQTLLIHLPSLFPGNWGNTVLWNLILRATCLCIFNSVWVSMQLKCLVLEIFNQAELKVIQTECNLGEFNLIIMPWWQNINIFYIYCQIGYKRGFVLISVSSSGLNDIRKIWRDILFSMKIIKNECTAGLWNSWWGTQDFFWLWSLCFLHNRNCRISKR